MRLALRVCRRLIGLGEQALDSSQDQPSSTYSVKDYSMVGGEDNQEK